MDWKRVRELLLGGWTDPRRPRVWLAVALAVYAAAGFGLAPWLIRRELPGVIRETLGREASLADARVNPFTLSLQLTGFELREPGGAPLLGFRELRLNLELRSLLRLAPVFSEVALIEPRAHLERAADGSLNLAKLVPAETEPAPSAEASELPRVVIDRFTITQGSATVADLVPAEPFRTRLGPVDVSVANFSTLPDDEGLQRVALNTDDGAHVTWQGSLRVSPLLSQGRIELSGSVLRVASRYFTAELPFSVAQADAQLALDYRVELPPRGELVAALSGLTARITNFALTADDDGREFLRAKEISLAGGEARWPEARVELDQLRIAGLVLTARRALDGSFDIERLVPSSPSAPATAAAAPAPGAPGAAAEQAPARALAVSLRTLELADWSLRIDDVIAPGAQLGVSDLDATLRNLSNQPGARVPFELRLALATGGTVATSGELSALPAPVVRAKVTGSEIALRVLQPRLARIARASLAGGALSFEGELSSTDAEPLAFLGDAHIDALDVRDDRGRALVGWRKLTLARCELAAGAARAEVAELGLDAPYLHLEIARDRSTNFGALLVATEPEPAAAPASAAAPSAAAPSASEGPPFSWAIGRVRVRNASADFADLGLVLPFATKIAALNGEIAPLDTASREPARISLEGSVGRYGLVQVRGQALAADPTQRTNVKLLFRNIDLPDFTPYSIDFAGRRIASGRVALELEYALAARKLEGRNKLVLSNFALGERVEAPNAMDLPLDLAIALLRGPDGTIDVDLPVSGDLDDPEFGYGQVIWRAFVKLIVRIATSPFRLLAGLVGGGDGTELQQIQFEPGRADLTPPELEKLAQLRSALAQRPQLAITAPRGFDPSADAQALRAARVSARVEAALAASKPSRRDDAAARTRGALEQLAAEAGIDTKALERELTVAPTPEEKPRLDVTAYDAELRRQLEQREAVPASALEGLATQRAEAIAAVLRADAPGVHVAIGALRELKAKDGWLSLELAAEASEAPAVEPPPSAQS